MGKGTICWELTDERSLEMVEVGCSREQNEDQGYDHDREGNGLEEQTSDEAEGQDTPANVCHDVHDPILDPHVDCLDQQPPQGKIVETSGGD